MCCAVAFRAFYFEAASTTIQTPEHKAKILVAKRTIPSGVEITGDFVAFQEVAVSEVPLGSLSSFAQVYRRQPAYPIPVGCPICEDLLLPHEEIAAQAAFVPTGSQFVALDIAHVRQGDQIFSPQKPLSAVLAADQRVDIRVVPPEAHGRLAEKKNAVLRTFASQDFRTGGELILENVPIHRIQRHAAFDHIGATKDSLMLMLDSHEAARLTAAAKRGQIRILVRRETANAPQPAEIKNIFDIADSPIQTALETAQQPTSVQTPPDSLPLEQPLSLNFPPSSEFPSPILTEVAAPTIPAEHVQKNAPAPSDTFDTGLPPAPTPVMSSSTHDEDGIPQNPDRIDRQLESPAIAAVPESITETKVAIRNDTVVNSLAAPIGPSPLRILSSERPLAEQNPALTRLPSPANEPGQAALSRPPSETVLGTPRVTNTIQFLTPGNIAPTKEHLQGIARRTEPVVIPPIMLPTMSQTIPSVIPMPTIAQEKVPGYSPFERRVYTVLPEGFGENSEELPAPQRLLKNPDSATQPK